MTALSGLWEGNRALTREELVPEGEYVATIDGGISWKDRVIVRFDLQHGGRTYWAGLPLPNNWGSERLNEFLSIMGVRPELGRKVRMSAFSGMTCHVQVAPVWSAELECWFLKVLAYERLSGF